VARGVLDGSWAAVHYFCVVVVFYARLSGDESGDELLYYST
jgi:hypothetical protein